MSETPGKKRAGGTNTTDARVKVRDEILKYYNDVQHILGSPQEALAFEETMRRPLPTTFWLNATDPRVYRVREMLLAMDRSVARPLTWYPEEGMAWRVEVPRALIRKDATLQHFHRYLISYSEWGVISRQEEVSMLPPYFLGITGTDRCLDMCASPGSKTAQMMYLLGRHKYIRAPPDTAFDYHSGGLVVANEMDVRRADMLISRMKRMALLYPFCVFTTHDARTFPTMLEADGKTEFLFDKVLCDVMCSGDGTMRKNTQVWKTWAVAGAYSLNPNQLKVAFRGAQLLKVGGRMVYSTCAMNPIEDEAVVYHLIKASGGAMRLVDPSTVMPSYSQRRDGLLTWEVYNPLGKENIPKTAYPPATLEEAKALNLQWCLRVMPQDDDTGGFFIAVLEKTEAFEGFPPEETTLPEVYRAPYLKASESAVQSIRDFYGVSHGNAVLAEDCLVTHEQEIDVPSTVDGGATTTMERVGNGKESNTINFVSDEVRALLAAPTARWKILNAGLRMFAKDRLGHTSGCEWRPCNEAVTLVRDAMGPSRLVRMDHATGVMLLLGPNKTLATKDIPCPVLKASVYLLPPGGIVLSIEGKVPGSRPLLVAGLRTNASLSATVDALDLPSYLHELGVETALK